MPTPRQQAVQERNGERSAAQPWRTRLPGEGAGSWMPGCMVREKEKEKEKEESINQQSFVLEEEKKKES